MVGYLYYTEETGLDRAPYPNIAAGPSASPPAGLGTAL